MNNKSFYLLSYFIFISFNVFAQKDSVQLEEVVVTATRSERTLAALNMPVLLITQKQIQQMGALRLGQVLQEQTGLVIINDHGQGIQMQGLAPEYTLILIDGEPLIGRTAGTLELSRLAVGNIKQIEIIKGATSSLYGSEALGGVINIITENPKQQKISFSSRYGTNQTSDLGLNASVQNKKWGGSVFMNRYGSLGYDFTPESFGKTVEPFSNYTFQSKIQYEFSPKVKLGISGRYFSENQDSNFDVGNTQNPAFVTGKGSIKDFNFNPSVTWRISDKWKSYIRLYQSVYETKSNLNYISDNEEFDKTFFKQRFLRPELQTEYFISEKHILTLGLGNTWEAVEATRYEGKKSFQTQYAYTQYEFLPTKKWNITFGSRFDNHTVYGSQLSPKLSLQYDVNKYIALRGSVGRGFKAPDFRQLYLNFTNTVAGYSVFGSEELPSLLQNLQAQNQIAEVLLAPTEIGKLKAETSTSYNIGAKIKPSAKWTVNVNLFRNELKNMIESQIVAIRTTGQSIFSYRNLNNIFTQGLETDMSYKLNQYIQISGGYQFLEAKDREVLDKIEKGEIFKRDANTFITTRISKNEYGGLFGRSKHMFNFKIFYENTQKGITANIRAIYRGKYGLGDRNGNLILDETNEYVVDYWTFHFATSKDFWKKRLKGQVGIDNMLNYKDIQNIPSLAGRLYWASIQWQIQKNTTK
ncbi:colicin I receptor [bacterium 336/3]|nr:colicin I receptor [bacterium 336/3]